MATRNEQEERDREAAKSWRQLLKRHPMETKKQEEAKTGARDHEAAKAELVAEWDRRLACLQDPDADERVKASLDARGQVKMRSKAGSSF